MSVWQAKKGDSMPCMVAQEVLALYWTRTRARPGEKVTLGAIVKDVKDGKPVKLTVLAANEAIASLDGTLSGGKVEVEWTITLPERVWPSDLPLVFDVVVDGKLNSNPSQRSTLHVDLGLPTFSL